MRDLVKLNIKNFGAKDGGGLVMSRFLKGYLEIFLSSKEEEDSQLHFWESLF
jgi:hypothetical protein